jgi:hypothetical protein
VRLGPASPVLSYIPPNPQANGLGYNPRCIIRDISSYISSDWTNDSDIYNLITQYTDIGSFQSRLQGDFAQKYFGIHSGGHYTIRGDPGGDFFASPGDPYFFFQRECSCSFPSHHHSSALSLRARISNQLSYSKSVQIADFDRLCDRPPFMDMAEPRPRSSNQRYRWHHYIQQYPAIKGRDSPRSVGSERHWYSWCTRDSKYTVHLGWKRQSVLLYLRIMLNLEYLSILVWPSALSIENPVASWS